MKKLSLLLSLFTLFVLQIAHAQDQNTFYVCSATQFTMVPQDTNHLGFEWTEVGVATPIAATKRATVTAPTITDSTFQTKRYTLMVKDSGDCWSARDTFTVHFLPPIKVTVTGNSAPHCSVNGDSVTLASTVGALTLPAGVTASQYTWLENGFGAGTDPTFTFNATNAGNIIYTCEVRYALPSSIGGEKLGTCMGSGTTTLVVYQTPITPQISIQ